jgi:low affinity Fe/Cu permease
MKNHKNIIEVLAHKATIFSGSSTAFIFALITIMIWIIVGPYFKFSDTWQLVINTSTTIITFLMVFLIQRMQNKDSKALHLKLNELVAALYGPSNRLINAENLTEKEIGILSNYYKKLAEMSGKEKSLSESHSIEEAIELHKTQLQKSKLLKK